jgi:dipeptidyl aminopeptidase/acylaminoacyl peptidase
VLASLAPAASATIDPPDRSLHAPKLRREVDAVKAPILIMHGPDDTVVPIAQSRAMEKKLKDAGKAVRFVLLQGDDHWLSYAPTRTQMLEESEKFLAENLK